MRQLAVVLLIGCGRIGFDATGSSLGGDAGDTGDGGDGSVVTQPGACLDKWAAGPTLSSPTRIAELATANADDDPWVSDDGLRIYFVRQNGNNSDMAVATRSTPTGTFGQPSAAPFANINSNGNELRPWLSPDEREITFVTVNGPTGFDLATATRGDATGVFGQASSSEFVNINTTGADMDPAVSSDNKRLYYTMAPITNQSVALATRTASFLPYENPAPIAELNDASNPDAQPAISRDERLIVWTTLRGGGSFNLYYATRSSAVAAFGTAKPVPNVNTALDEERSPFLSADSCTLYFTSNRAGGAGMDDIYVATVQ